MQIYLTTGGGERGGAGRPLDSCFPLFCIYNNPVEYEWDDAKDAANQFKHGVAFAQVLRFDWDAAIVLPDNRRDYGEPRWFAFGPINGRLHCLVFTKRGECIRVISLRKANQREVTRYEQSRP